jgi:membrane-associated protease RseP (regulator of RpoE activity)
MMLTSMPGGYVNAPPQQLMFQQPLPYGFPGGISAPYMPPTSAPPVMGSALPMMPSTIGFSAPPMARPMSALPTVGSIYSSISALPTVGSIYSSMSALPTTIGIPTPQLPSVGVVYEIGTSGTAKSVPIIKQVQPGSLADKAGLRLGDQIISVGIVNSAGWHATNTETKGYPADKFSDLLKKTLNDATSAGGNMLVQVERSGQVMFVVVGYEPRAAPKVSVGLDFSIIPGQEPTVVKVEPGSAASRAGLLPGDVILSLSSTKTPTRTPTQGVGPDQFSGLLKQTFQTATSAGGKMILQVQRSGQVFFAEVGTASQSMGMTPSIPYPTMTPSIPYPIRGSATPMMPTYSLPPTYSAQPMIIGSAPPMMPTYSAPAMMPTYSAQPMIIGSAPPMMQGVMPTYSVPPTYSAQPIIMGSAPPMMPMQPIIMGSAPPMMPTVSRLY